MSYSDRELRQGTTAPGLPGWSGPSGDTTHYIRHAQALAALKAWCHWLSQLHSLALKDSSYEPQCKGIVNHALNK